jgi:hypothetical protein
MIACGNCGVDVDVAMDDLARELHQAIHHHMQRQATIGGYPTELELRCYASLETALLLWLAFMEFDPDADAKPERVN